MLVCEACVCGTLIAEAYGKSQVWAKCFAPRSHRCDLGLGTVIHTDLVRGRDKRYQQIRATMEVLLRSKRADQHKRPQPWTLVIQGGDSVWRTSQSQEMTFTSYQQLGNGWLVQRFENSIANII